MSVRLDALQMRRLAAADAQDLARHNRWIHWTVIVAGIFGLAMLFASFVGVTQYYGHWMRDIAELVVLTMVLIVFNSRRKLASDPRVARFWALWMGAFAAWLIVVPAGILAAELWPGDTPQIAYTLNLPYVLFYGMVIAALQSQPHVSHDALGYKLRVLEWTATLLFSIGLLAYFMVIPSLNAGESTIIWSSSTTAYVALDAVVIGSLWYLRGIATREHWRRNYSWLLSAAIAWGLGDVLILLANEGVFMADTYALPLGLFWMASFAALARSATIRGEAGEDGEELVVPNARVLGMEPLVVYASVPLVLHVLLERFADPDPDLAPLRAGLALAMTLVIMTITLAY